jgi:membrane associated rhomboid family serine protease
MTACPACGETLPTSAARDDLCQACVIALETGKDPQSTGADLSENPVPKKSKAALTNGLIVINLLIFVAMRIAGKSGSELSHDQLLNWGADWGPLSLHYQWWRMFTSTFLHLSWDHLLNNLLILWILGRRAEPVFGRFAFSLLYVGSGLAASIGSLAITPETLTCGASGAVFGLFGALVSAFLLGKVALSDREKWWFGLLSAALIYSLYAGASNPGVGNSAHVAGFAFGIVFGALASSPLAGRPEFRRWISSGAVGVLLAGAIPVQLANGYLTSMVSADRALNHGQPDEALFYVNAVLKRSPDSSLANITAGQCYFQKHDYTKAEVLARKVLAKDADDGPAELLLGRVLIRTGRGKDAVMLGVKMALEGRNKRQAGTILLEAMSGDARVVMADALRDKKPDFAIGLYKQALEDWPENYQALRGLSQAYQKQGMQKEAAETAAKAEQVQAAQSQQ